MMRSGHTHARRRASSTNIRHVQGRVVVISADRLTPAGDGRTFSRTILRGICETADDYSLADQGTTSAASGVHPCRSTTADGAATHSEHRDQTVEIVAVFDGREHLRHAGDSDDPRHAAGSEVELRAAARDACYSPTGSVKRTVVP